MKSQQPESTRNIREFENDSHISRKKKAVANSLHTKNKKQIIELIDSEDEDEDPELYARYIK